MKMLADEGCEVSCSDDTIGTKALHFRDAIFLVEMEDTGIDSLGKNIDEAEATAGHVFITVCDAKVIEDFNYLPFDLRVVKRCCFCFEECLCYFALLSGIEATCEGSLM